jgi:4-hydroxy-3-methylbut-2-enyl diphosphate reductase IspH
MKVIKLLPYGWCEGVAYALTKLQDIIKAHSDKQVYLIG